MRAFPIVILLACGPLALTACPGTLDEPQRFRVDSGATLAPPLDSGASTVDCMSTATTLLSGTCAVAGCHATASPASGNLDLATGDVRTRLRNVPATGDSRFLLINTQTPEQSAIYLKTADMPPFGESMPPGQKLDATTRQCLLSWIQATPPGPPGTGSGDAGAD